MKCLLRTCVIVHTALVIKETYTKLFLERYVVGLLVLSKSRGSTATRPSKVDTEKLPELVVVVIIKHDLSVQFVEYDGIRICFLMYLRILNLLLGVK